MQVDHISSTAKNPFERIYILLVEDNKVNQIVASAILRKAGCIVMIADNGLEAVNQIKKEPFHAVLMDCQMPVMDGFEATRQIRNLGEPWNKIPIIAVTAYAMEHDREKCLESGMNDYLSKPVSRMQLLDIVKKYTDGTEYHVN